MALQLIRAARSLDEFPLVNNLMHLLIEVVEPLVASSPMRVMFLRWRPITGNQQRPLSAQAAVSEFTVRAIHQTTNLFKKHDSSQNNNVAAEISRIRHSTGGYDALAKFIGGRLDRDFVLQMLRSLKHDPDTAFFFFKWAGEQEVYEHDSTTYSRMIQILASANRLEDVEGLLQRMMHKAYNVEFEAAVDLIVSYSNSGMVDRAQRIFNQLKQVKGRKFPVHVWNALFSALEKAEKYKEVQKMTEELTEQGVVLAESTLDVLVRIFCKNQAYDKVVWLLDRSKGLQLNAMALSMVVDGLCKTGREYIAVKIYEEAAMSQARARGDKSFICCSLVCGIFRTGDLVKASYMIRRLANDGLLLFSDYTSETFSDWQLTFPDQGRVFTFLEIVEMFRGMRVGLGTFEYNCFIEGLCKAGKLDDAQRAYALMRENGIPADIYTYNYMLECIIQAGRVEDAQRVLEAMEETGTKPDVFTYTRLLNGFCRTGKLDDALGIYSRMRDADCSPDAVTFGCMISGFCKAEKFPEALRMLKFSMEAGFEPDEVTYSSIIDPLCKLELWESALDVFELVRERGSPGSVFLYSRLMNCLCKAGKVETACLLLHDMVNGENKSGQLLGGDNCEPDVVIYTSIIDALCELGKVDEAFMVVKDMEAKGLKPDVVTYTTFLRAFCESGLIDDACKLLEMMVKAGCNPDIYAYNTLMSSLCTAGREDEACGLLQVMVENGCEPNSFTYGLLIAVLCRTKKLEAAMHLFHYMKLSRCVPELSTYKELIYGYYRQGNVSEARRILEQESKAFSMNNPGKSLLSELHQSGSLYERRHLSGIIGHDRLQS